MFGREPSVNGVCVQFPLRDDDIFRVVVAKGKKVLSVDEMNKSIEIAFPKNCNETTRQYFKVEVFGNIFCDASINGDVISHGTIECNQINGDIKECKDSVSCNGDINGSVYCGSNIECKTIEGDAECQGDIIYK